ncbi:DUF6115 domain-containing protein [Natribacillus halophilus]|uniref:Uncharacterized protein n=1 Tax=Natribacillus halophilus TaxID=549003 RepID=A0A1G8PPJ1_9BACI|nr:hypothetical protein [Natribacillus halophilus]SDI94312.1 hypothetical protein SAMN04488123_10939 [Natribacillus halophilus]
MTLFVIVSMLLHIVSVTAILYLYRQSQKTAAPEEKIEQLLISYTEEMKKDNERLLQRLKPQQAERVFQSELTQALQNQEEKEAKRYEPPEPAGENEIEVTPAAQALRLAHIGKSKEEIARELSLTSGEVELLLKKRDGH